MRWRWRSSPLQDSMWRPGTAAARLPVIAEMLDRSLCERRRRPGRGGPPAPCCRADRAGRPGRARELASYISLAERLGHARGRWGALTRRATLAQLIGRADEAARARASRRSSSDARSASPTPWPASAPPRWSLVALGVPEPRAASWSRSTRSGRCFPIFQAWPHAARGDAAATRPRPRATSACSTSPKRPAPKDSPPPPSSSPSPAPPDQRSWTYERLRPLAGTHVIVAGCASYHAAVDHHLGALAASLGDTAAAEHHFRAAIRLHERLGAAGWARLSEQALARPDEPSHRDGQRVPPRRRAVASRLPRPSRPAGRLQGPAGSRLAHRRPGTDVHVFTLLGMETPRTGADPDPRRHRESAVPDPPPRPRRPDRRGRGPSASPRTLSGFAPSVRRSSTNSPPPPDSADAPVASAIPPNAPAKPSAPAFVTPWTRSPPMRPRPRPPPSRQPAPGHPLRVRAGQADCLDADQAHDRHHGTSRVRT